MTQTILITGASSGIGRATARYFQNQGYLEKTALPAPEISFLLGFEEPSSFYRAFRAWTGNTPDHVRHARKDPR